MECVRATENPMLIWHIMQVATGEHFLLWGRAYRRQSTYQEGDTVLYLCEAERLHLGRGGAVLQNGKMVTTHYRGLRYAHVDTREYSVIEYHADGNCNGLMEYAVLRNAFAPDTVCTPLGVRLS